MWQQVRTEWESRIAKYYVIFIKCSYMCYILMLLYKTDVMFKEEIDIWNTYAPIHAVFLTIVEPFFRWGPTIVYSRPPSLLGWLGYFLVYYAQSSFPLLRLGYMLGLGVGLYEPIRIEWLNSENVVTHKKISISSHYYNFALFYKFTKFTPNIDTFNPSNTFPM